MLPRLVVFLLAVAVVCVVADDDVDERDVIVFTDSDFSSRIDDYDIILVEFFAPWCGHCKRLKPEYAKAATILKSADPAVAIAKVDCDANKDTCQKYGVSGYPTLKIFRNGAVAEDYNGPRDADGIARLMKSKAGPSSKTLSSAADLEKFIKNDEHSIVAFVTSENSEKAREFKKLADSLTEKYRFGLTADPALLEKYGPGESIIVFQPERLHSKFEQPQAKFSPTEPNANMRSWVTENVNGLCGHRTQGNADQFNKKPLVVVYYAVNFAQNRAGTAYWRNRILKVESKLREAGKQVYFAISNADDFASELDSLGLKFGGDKPVAAAWSPSDGKFVMTTEFSVDNLETFANDFLEGKLEAYIKSEPVPNEQGPVKVVVGKTFNEIVNDPTKDVLVEFYAPWCGHCKSLEPIYKELAEKLADEDDVVIAKMDATANDVPSPYEVSGFPTIYFAPKGSKSSPKKYNGGRTVDDFIKYLASESTAELQGFNRKGKAKKKEL